MEEESKEVFVIKPHIEGLDEIKSMLNELNKCLALAGGVIGRMEAATLTVTASVKRPSGSAR